MSKVPQRDDIWKHKEKGYLARVVNISGFSVSFYDNQTALNLLTRINEALR